MTRPALRAAYSAVCLCAPFSLRRLASSGGGARSSGGLRLRFRGGALAEEAVQPSVRFSK
jgi:hypothetical protein